MCLSEAVCEGKLELGWAELSVLCNWLGEHIWLCLGDPELEAMAKLSETISQWSNPDRGLLLQKLWFDFIDWLLQTVVWLPRLIAAVHCSESYCNIWFGQWLDSQVFSCFRRRKERDPAQTPVFCESFPVHLLGADHIKSHCSEVVSGAAAQQNKNRPSSASSCAPHLFCPKLPSILCPHPHLSAGCSPAQQQVLVHSDTWQWSWFYPETLALPLKLT